MRCYLFFFSAILQFFDPFQNECCQCGCEMVEDLRAVPAGVSQILEIRTTRIKKMICNGCRSGALRVPNVSQETENWRGVLVSRYFYCILYMLIDIFPEGPVLTRWDQANICISVKFSMTGQLLEVSSE